MIYTSNSGLKSVFLPSQQAAILEDLVRDVPVEFDFLFSSSHAEVISGKQEGETESCEPDGNMVQLYLDTGRFLGSPKHKLYAPLSGFGEKCLLSVYILV